MKHIKRHTKQTEEVLRRWPNSRNDDMILFAGVCHLNGLEFTREQWALLRKCPTLEAVTRTRRRLQEQGLYPATAAVQAERDKKARKLGSQQVTEQVLEDIF